MGGSLRKSAPTTDGGTLATHGVGVGEGGDADAVTAFPSNAAEQQRLAFDRAEAANGKLKEKKRASEREGGGGHHSTTTSGGASGRRKSKRSSTTIDGSTTPTKKEPVWHKPTTSAVIAAATLRDEDMEVETIDIDHSFAQKSSTAANSAATTTQHTKHASLGHSGSTHEFGGVMPQAPSQPLHNPWAKPNALSGITHTRARAHARRDLFRSFFGDFTHPADVASDVCVLCSFAFSSFTRNFQEESADAELFVQIARDRAKVEQKKANKKKSSGSIIVAHQNQRSSIDGAASETQRGKRSQFDDDEDEPTRREEEEEESF